MSLRVDLPYQTALRRLWPASGAELVGGIAIPVRTRAALKALDTDRQSDAFLCEGNRFGYFLWDATVPQATHQADTAEGYYVAPDAAADGAWVRQHDQGLIADWFYETSDGDNYQPAFNRALALALILHVSVLGLSGARYRIYGAVRIWPDADGWTPPIIAAESDFVLGRDAPPGGFTVADEQSGFRWMGLKNGAPSNALSGGFTFRRMDAQNIAVSNGVRCCHTTNSSNVVIKGTIVNMAFGYGVQFYRYYDGGPVVGNNQFEGSINGVVQGIAELFKWYGYADDGDLSSAMPGTLVGPGASVPIVSEGRFTAEASAAAVASLGVNNFWTNSTGAAIAVPALPYTEASLKAAGLVKGKLRAEFTGSITGNTLTVSSVASGSIKVGMEVIGDDVAYGTFITAKLSATTWAVSGSAQNVAAGPLSAAWTSQIMVQRAVVTGSITANVLDVTAVTSGAIYPGMVLHGIGLGTGRTVLSNGTGTGGIGTYNLVPLASSDAASTEITGGFLFDAAKATYIESGGTVIADCPVRNTLGNVCEAYIDGGYYNVYLGSSEGAIVKRSRLRRGVRAISGEWKAKNSDITDLLIEDTLSSAIVHAWGSEGLRLKRAGITHTARWTGQASVTLYLSSGRAILDDIDIKTTNDATGDYNIYFGPDCSHSRARNIRCNGRVSKAYIAVEGSWRATLGVTDNYQASPEMIGAFTNATSNIEIVNVTIDVNTTIGTAPSAVAIIQNDEIGVSDVRIDGLTALDPKHNFGIRVIEGSANPALNGVTNCRLRDVHFDPAITRDKMAAPRGRKHWRAGRLGISRVSMFDDEVQRSVYMPSAGICDATHGTRFVLNGGSAITAIQDNGTGSTGQAPADGHLIEFRGNTAAAQQITNGPTIRLKGGVNATLTDIQTLTLRYDSANTAWIEQGRGF